MITHYKHATAYRTKDGSIIRELFHPFHNNNKNQSLAEAIIPVNTETRLHRHLTSEEIYHVTQGKGLMTLGKETLAVQPGDTIGISPGTEHKIKNTGETDLKIICSCAPAYSHEDTELL